MIIKNVNIVLENEIIKGWIEVENKIIKSINKGTTKEEGIDGQDNWVLPGFIDCHVHGGYGVDFESGDKNRFDFFAKNISKEGITRYCQGSVTNSTENNKKYFTEFKEFMEKQNNGAQSRCVGCHMEGPFISPARKGAHELSLLQKPNIELMKEIIKISGDNISLVTYAPDEQDGTFTKFLIDNNIIPSAGHTDISADDFENNHYKTNIKHITHLFNGMSGVSQHEPGLATSSLLHDEILCEVISDGIHIKEQTLKLIYKIKGPENICIITDAMNAKGLPDGEYKLGALPVIKDGMKVYLKDSGTLAGAGATYDHNVRTMMNAIGNVPMTDLIKMTSINVAKQLNIFDKTGSIEVNKLADLVILDKKFNVVSTIVEGEAAFNK